MLLVIAIAVGAADLTWKLVPGASVPVAVAPVGVANTAAAAAPNAQQLADQVAARHLFGIAGALDAEPVKPVEAPDTRLRLTLRGVIAHDNAPSARAIIAAADGDENAYAVGQEVPGGVTVSEIRADHVLLERGGRFEVLRMPKESVGDGLTEVAAPSRGTSAAAGGDVDLGDLRTRPLREIRDDLVANPDAVTRLMRVVPIQQGDEFKGFRLMAGNQTHLLERLGFQRGDIVTAVNGIALDNPVRGLEALREITEAQSSLEITVMRNGNPQVLSISLE